MHRYIRLLPPKIVIIIAAVFELVANLSINLAMESQRKRRECGVYGKSYFLEAFDASNARIAQQHSESSARILSEGIKMMERLTDDFIKSMRGGNDPTTSFELPSQQSQPVVHFIAKELIEEKDEEEIIWDRTEKKSKEKGFTGGSFKSHAKKQEMQLQESLKKMGLDDHFEAKQDSHDEEDENTNLLNFDHLEHKSITQLIQESNRKVQEKKASQQADSDDDSDTSYPLTEYSSNNSSNENDYEEKIQSESSGKGSNGGSNPFVAQNSFGQPMNLLHSPKKSKSNKKRLYMRNKKIPRWAQDMEKVKETVLRQMTEMDPDKIYGRCVVERLDTNIIFGHKEDYVRGSSARWAREFAP